MEDVGEDIREEIHAYIDGLMVDKK
jgi:hypothetical protein